jgi:hypothetical protein
MNIQKPPLATYAEDYYCDNYFAAVQIFKGNAYCFANFTLTASVGVF